MPEKIVAHSNGFRCIITTKVRVLTKNLSEVLRCYTGAFMFESNILLCKKLYVNVKDLKYH